MDICVNLGDKDTLGSFDATACDGVGLFRTNLFTWKEFLPQEEEQFEIYKNMAVRAGKQPVIIRTLDIGGDKIPEYMDIEKEDNPFLGYRAHTDLSGMLKLLNTIAGHTRASAYGCIKIMFPMIVTLSEVNRLNYCSVRWKTRLDKERSPLIRIWRQGL